MASFPKKDKFLKRLIFQKLIFCRSFVKKKHAFFSKFLGIFCSNFAKNYALSNFVGELRVT
jgi:hypothetical protein